MRFSDLTPQRLPIEKSGIVARKFAGFQVAASTHFSNDLREQEFFPACQESL
jgi:hypothetical protein